MPNIIPNTSQQLSPQCNNGNSNYKWEWRKVCLCCWWRRKVYDSESEEKTDLEDREKGEWTKVSRRIRKKLHACHLVGSYVSPCTCGQVYVHPVDHHHQYAVPVERRVFPAHPLWQDLNLKLNIIAGSEVTCYCLSLNGYSCTPHVWLTWNYYRQKKFTAFKKHSWSTKI